jgi:hypothetical protein
MTTTRALVVLLLATGCGSLGGGVPREQYTAESFKAICTHYANCGLAKSADGCNQYFQSIVGAYITTSTSVYDKAIELGKIKYDSAAASRCLSGYANAACSLAALTSPASDCRSIYVGQVPVGQACGYGECVPSAYCTTEADGKCPGTCKDRVQAGGAATSQASCAVGLVLISGSCSQPPGENSSCGTGTTSVCAAGLTCATDTKTCTRPRVQGDACSSTMACDIFYRCVNGTCAAPADVGGACGQSTGGLSCKLELFCNGTVCAERFAEGATCTGSECANNLRCGKATAAAANKTCNKPLAAGATCASTTDCDAALFCSSTSKTCIAQLAAGAACTTSDVCSAGICTSGKCVSYLTSTCF